MVARHHHSSSLVGGLFKRIFRSFFAVVILTAFVLLLSLFIKGLANTDYKNLSLGNIPLLSRLGFKTLGEVAGSFKANTSSQKEVATTDNKPSSSNSEPVKFSVAVMSDSHESNINLTKALDISKESKVAAVFHLGDLTNFGVDYALVEAKKVIDTSKLTYYVLPGDHDLWKTVGPQNFLEVFKQNYQSVVIEGVKFVMLDNSANYTLVDKKQMEWFKNELKDADYVFLSQPIYHPYIKIYMGIVNGEEQPEMLAQAQEILGLIRSSNVRAVIAGDQHNMSIYPDPEKPSLQHIAAGALADERNLQSPRFFILNVHTDKTFSIDEKVL